MIKHFEVTKGTLSHPLFKEFVGAEDAFLLKKGELLSPRDLENYINDLSKPLEFFPDVNWKDQSLKGSYGEVLYFVNPQGNIWMDLDKKVLVYVESFKELYLLEKM